jgi:hypothetical protein
VNLHLHALFLIALKMKLHMHILSLALLAMAGVTAEGPVRAYYPSLFVCFRESSNRSHRAAKRAAGYGVNLPSFAVPIPPLCKAYP